MRYTTSTFIIFRANARVKTRQRLNDRVLDDVAYDIDSEMIVPLFMDEVDISGVDWVVELQTQEVANCFSNFSCMFLNPNNFFQFES